MGVTLFALILSGFGGYFLSKRQASKLAQQEAIKGATTLTNEFQTVESKFNLATCQLTETSTKCLNRLLLRVRLIEKADNATFIVIGPQGNIKRGILPKKVTTQMINIPNLLAGSPQTGLINNTSAFAAIPLPPTALQTQLFKNSTVVVVLTRTINVILPNPKYFLVAALISLIIAGSIAIYLSSRISKPLITVAKTTDQISNGDLSARVPIEPHDYEELKELSHAINKMALSLETNKQLERDFFLAVSHELNTPLTSILGYSEAISDNVSDNVQKDAAVIKTQALRLQRLVQDILNLAKLESPQFAVNLVRDSVNMRLSEIIDSYKNSKIVLEKQLSINTNLTNLPTMAMIDPDRFKQMISNLVDNATKYASSLIAISSNLSNDGKFIQLDISDDGKGITSSDINNIFNRYYRSKSQPDNVTGSGLGLTIAKELALKMNAELRVSSPTNNGSGTTFTVKIPVAV